MVQMELTELDRTIMNMIAQGYSTPRIAKTLNYTEGTITNRLTLLFRIFNVKNRTQLVLKAIKYQVLDIQKIKYPRVQAAIRSLPLKTRIRIAFWIIFGRTDDSRSTSKSKK